MKRVSPLKHQPETTDSDGDGKVQGQGLVLGEPADSSKDDPDKQTHASSDGREVKPKSLSGGVGGVGGSSNPQALFGELEHYDLDMDEILDVPYIKSSQQMSTLPRVPHDKRSVTGSNMGGGTLERNRGGGLKNSTLPHNEPLSLGSSSSQTPVSPSEFFRGGLQHLFPLSHRGNAAAVTALMLLLVQETMVLLA